MNAAAGPPAGAVPGAARGPEPRPVAGRPAPCLWGIVNVTPDSFSDGGRTFAPAAAIAHGVALAAAGAGVLDVGGESTRPGARAVDPDEECRRVLPVIEGLAREAPGVPLSVDTRRGGVAERALDAGARIVNDVSAGEDPGLLRAVARARAGLVLMHMQGTPATMQQAPRYRAVLADVVAFLLARVARARAAGVAPEAIWIDPGIGFGKTLEHNLALLAGLSALKATGQRVLLGASRKSFLGALTGRAPGERLGGSLACAVRAWQAGVDALRVHDVGPTRDLYEVLGRLGGAGAPPA